MEVEAQDWEHLYEKNFQQYIESFKLSKELAETKEAKQQNYIFREQEYRTVIQGLKDEIEQVS